MRREERGVALLTVLILVAVIATLAAAVLEDVRFTIRRTANAEAVGQARWYARGVETLAASQIGRLTRREPQRTSLQGGWNGRTTAFPIDGGTAQGRVEDGVACFNLNSVVIGAGEQLVARPAGQAQFRALAQALGVAGGEAEALAAALTDWIDSDEVRERGGAEDEAYSRGPQPYRTSGALLAEASELRAIRGFAPDTYRRLRPFVCALPTTDLSPINVNTLASDQASLITMLTAGAVAPEVARQVLGRRPVGGWTDIHAFWRDEAFIEAPPSPEAYQQAQVRTRYFRVETAVRFADAEAVSSALLEQDPAGEIRLIARRWTRDE